MNIFTLSTIWLIGMVISVYAAGRVKTKNEPLSIALLILSSMWPMLLIAIPMVWLGTHVFNIGEAHTKKRRMR